MKSNISLEKKKLNLGIELLRVFLCFWVLSYHSLDSKKINYYFFYFFKTKLFHVPCFTFISFFFTFNIFKSKNSIKMKKRLERLLIPYFFWPMIIFTIVNISNKKIKISLYDLKIQLLCGYKFLIPLWYLFAVTLLSILYFILSKFFPKTFLFFIHFFSIFSYIFQYSRFSKKLYIYKYIFRNPILHLISITPLSIYALDISSLKLIEGLKKRWKTNFFFSNLFLFFIFKYDIFIDIGGYDGIIHLFFSSCWFLSFYILPLENANNFIQKLIKEITRYTNGIYCLHWKIISFLKIKFHSSGKMKNSIIIYLLSYFFSFN